LTLQRPVISLKLKVVPGASRAGIDGWLGDRLKVRVTSAPDKGKANKELIALLSTALALPKKNLHISSGLSSRFKVVEISELEPDELNKRLPDTSQS
tara:strand:+ start:718 stop:1008 length:291 start_codon:yes stop_codon:yes gene_type:complete